MTHPTSYRISLLLCSVLAVSLAACSDDDGGAGGGGGVAGLGRGEFGIAAGLAELPQPEAEDEPLRISIADVAAVSEANGLELPDTVQDVDGDWLGPVTGSEDSVAMLSPPNGVVNLDQAAFAEATGFSWAQSDWFATVSSPPDDFAVYAGSPADADLSSIATELDGGLLSIGEGEDYAPDLEGDLSVDELGRPLRLAQERDRLATSLSTPMLEAWRDEQGDTLADDDSLAAVADTLDDAGVVSAVLQTLGEDADVPTVGVGWSVVDGDPQVAVAYDLGSDDAADEAVAEIESAYTDGSSAVTEQPYADLVPFDGAEAVGRVVVVRVAAEPGRVMVPLSMLDQQDLPYLTGG